MKQRGQRARQSVRTFHVVWVRPPSDEIIAEAGARALRLHAERQAAKVRAAEPEEESPV